MPEGVFSIGRLDQDSEGLILLTNDGKLGFRLSHPRFEIEKVYRVGVQGNLTKDVPERLIAGIEMEEGTARAKRVAVLDRGVDSTTLEITLTEGKKREIRRMLAVCGYEVEWLKRVRFGTVLLGDLRAGTWRHLTRDEVRGLRRLVEQAYLKKLKGD
jgi:pseudouridine synthase